MDIMTCMETPAAWSSFEEALLAGGHLSRREEKMLREYITREGYHPILKSIRRGEAFGFPERIEINKKSTGKKRVVYRFEDDQNLFLKMLGHQLHRFDGIFTPNLYSFRRGRSARTAIESLTKRWNPQGKYVYKVDIHDYFNSIDINRLLPVLRETLGTEDTETCNFLEQLLREDRVYVRKYASEKKRRRSRKFGASTDAPDEEFSVVRDDHRGIMAGTPTASFLANLYLREMDEYFFRNRIRYARYSDDIIVFADSAEKREEYRLKILDTLAEKGLTVNPRKEASWNPGESWDFLGVSCNGREVDLTDIAREKVKGKIKRKARAFRRWKCRKNVEDTAAIRAYFRYFNRKFYENPVQNELTWSRWYFPLLTTDTSLHEIDRYLTENARYLATGHYTKSNYNLRYEELRELGFRSLVNEYWKGRKGKDEPLQEES